MELRYDADWVDADLGRPLSLSLPFNLQNLPLRGEKVANYFRTAMPSAGAWLSGSGPDRRIPSIC